LVTIVSVGKGSQQRVNNRTRGDVPEDLLSAH